jgi:hypothetical protein
MLATQALIDGSISNYWAGVSGEGNRIILRWRPNKKRKRTSITTVQRDQYLSFATFPTPPCFSLVTTFRLRSISKLKAKIDGIGLVPNNNCFQYMSGNVPWLCQWFPLTFFTARGEDVQEGPPSVCSCLVSFYFIFPGLIDWSSSKSLLSAT